MKTKNRVLSAVLFSLFAAAGASAEAAQFSTVCSFGDSLSDAGYYRPFLRSIGIPESIVQQLGSFTTNPDPVWDELVAQYYGVAPNPSNAGGCIYAQGGARVALTPGITPPGSAERPVSTQITEYLAAHNGAADPNALYTVWAGANDFFVNNSLLAAGQISAATFQSNILAAATAEVQQTARLFQAGARNVMVMLNFDAAMTPTGLALDATTRAGLTQLTAGANTTMLTGFAGSNLRPIVVDLFSLFNEIRANPSSFGFTNITSGACTASPLANGSTSSQFCLIGLNVPANAQNTFLFADSTGHLTGAGNRLVAQFAEQMIEGPYNYSQLAEVPLRTRALHVQGVSEGLASGQYAEPGKWTVFVAGGTGKYDVDSAIGNTGVQNNTDAYTVGVTMRASESVTLGAAFGQTKARGRFADSLGDYHLRDNTYSLFAALKWRGLYATGVASIADIDYNDLHRNVVLGPQVRTATGSTSGSNASAFVSAGYDFALGRFLVGPTVSGTWQDVEVAGFDEANAGSANLRIFSQKRQSEVWSAGVRASMDFEGFTPWIRVTADKERKDDPRVVTALPLTLVATNTNYDVVAYQGDTTYTTFMGGVRGSIAHNIAFGITYYKVSGRSGISEQGASASLSMKF